MNVYGSYSCCTAGHTYSCCVLICKCAGLAITTHSNVAWCTHSISTCARRIYPVALAEPFLQAGLDHLTMMVMQGCFIAVPTDGFACHKVCKSIINSPHHSMNSTTRRFSSLRGAAGFVSVSTTHNHARKVASRL